MPDLDLTQDHRALTDAHETRRYFAKFARITKHLRAVTGAAIREEKLSDQEVDIVEGYVTALANTFTALSYKHLMAARVPNSLPHPLEIDLSESGFPVYRELLQMANDGMQVEQHLATSSTPDKLKQEMVTHILNDRSAPLKLQFALSQRLYYEALQEKAVFWAQNDPQVVWLGKNKDRNRYLIHWAVYDSQQNVPAIYLMYLEDSARKPIPRDERRWPRVQAHLMAQSINSLKLLTIALGFDQDFDDLHPKTLRRIHLGPMYSHAYTRQTGPLREVLAEASGQPGYDWALAWTSEVLFSKRAERVSTGIFSSADREIFELDHFAAKQEGTGTTGIQRALILPQQPYQVLRERNPKGFENITKYVVGMNDQVLRYR